MPASRADSTSPTKSKKRKRGDEVQSDHGDDEARENATLNVLVSFVTRTPGDKYLLAHHGSVKTSDSLLSDLVDKPFTKKSFKSAIERVRRDELDRDQLTQDCSDAYADAYDEWRWLMDDGFSLFLHGLGGKRALLQHFASYLRERDDVVFVDGTEADCQLSDIVSAVESLSPAATTDDAARTISAVDRRIRPLAKVRFDRTVFIVLHSFDKVRWIRHLSSFAALVSHPHIRLCASVESQNAMFAFPPTLVMTRRASDQKNSVAAGLNVMHIHTPTYAPIFEDTDAALDLLGSFLPPSIVPSTTGGIGGQAILESVSFVLASVSDRAKAIFRLLIDEQASLYGQLTTAQKKKLDLRSGERHQQQQEQPEIAVALSKLKDAALESLTATHEEQVSALLAEFEDHGIVNRASSNGDDWLWVSLNEEELKELSQSV